MFIVGVSPCSPLVLDSCVCLPVAVTHLAFILNSKRVSRCPLCMKTGRGQAGQRRTTSTPLQQGGRCRVLNPNGRGKPPPQHETKRIEVECRDEITLGADSTGNSISFLQEHGFAFEIPCLLPRVREHLLLLLFHLCLVLVFCCVHCLRVLVVPCTILVNAFFILPCLSLVWKRHFKMKTPHTRAHAHENENAEEEKRTNQLLLLSICLRREGGGGIEKAKSQPETQDENQEGGKKKD